MRLCITLSLIILSFSSLSASDFKQVKQKFSQQSKRMLDISVNKELVLKERTRLLIIEIEKLDQRIEKLNREFLLKHKDLFFSMNSTHDYMEIYLTPEFNTQNCQNYRLSIIHGFSPQNLYPETTKIPDGAYFALKILANLCSNSSLLDFTPQQR